MSIWKFLGLERGDETSDSSDGDTGAIRRIVKELEDMEPEKARYLASFAYVLSRVAHADMDIS
ncbi:MAG: hypothetical protein GF355_14540, partial [Candidatus Eisenbacteria bacterium]|nr:hypothetical protein [Candidatus Eisenbacteria bacterium]